MKKKQAAAPVLAAGTSTAYHSTKNVNLKHEQVSLEQILQKFPSVESQLKSTPALEPHLAHLLLLPVPPSGRPLPPFLLAAPQNTPSSMPVGVAPLVPASSASAVAPPPASVAVSPHPAGRSHAFSIRAALEPSSASSTQWRSLAAPSGAPPLSGGGWQPPHSDDAPPAESIEAPLAGQHAYIANTNDTNHTDLMQFHVVSPVQSSDDAQLQLYPLRGAPQQQQPPPPPHLCAVSASSSAAHGGLQGCTACKCRRCSVCCCRRKRAPDGSFSGICTHSCSGSCSCSSSPFSHESHFTPKEARCGLLSAPLVSRRP